MTKQHLEKLSKDALAKTQCINSKTSARLAALANVISVCFEYDGVHYSAMFKDFHGDGKRCLYKVDWHTENISGTITFKKQES